MSAFSAKISICSLHQRVSVELVMSDNKRFSPSVDDKNRLDMTRRDRCFNKNMTSCRDVRWRSYIKWLINHHTKRSVKWLVLRTQSPRAVTNSPSIAGTASAAHCSAAAASGSASRAKLVYALRGGATENWPRCRSVVSTCARSQAPVLRLHGTTCVGRRVWLRYESKNRKSRWHSSAWRAAVCMHIYHMDDKTQGQSEFDILTTSAAPQWMCLGVGLLTKWADI